MRQKFLFFVTLSLSLLLPLALPSLASGATAEVIAFQAPDCTSSGNSSWCTAFLQSVLPKISGIGVEVPWNTIDLGTFSGGAPDYSFSSLDSFLNAYINNSSFNWSNGCVNGTTCKIVLIIEPESDATGLTAYNPYTPGYVFSTTYASHVGSDSPQDDIACSQMPGKSLVSSGGQPLPYSGTVGSADYVIWNTNSCKVLGGSDLTCSCSGTSCGIQNFTAFPVAYEKPIVTAYQNVLKALSANYSTGGPDYSTIGKYISYVRAGMALGGENLPLCADTASVALPDWKSGAMVSAGYVITPSANNLGGFNFVAIHGGTSGSHAPTWNQSPGNRTTSDGTATWENVGTRDTSGGTAMWPGVNGQFGSSPQPQAYTDNGYLRAWPQTGVTGYIAGMVKYLGGLGSSFSWDISSHYGPYLDIGYADSEAVITNALGSDEVGFGMQSLNVEDPITYAAGRFPTAREDWAANFTNYPYPSSVPIHHLQTNSPGNTYYAAGYSIQEITGNGTVATVTCDTGRDCSPFYGQAMFDSQYVVITGNPVFDGTWLVLCYSQFDCGSDTLTLSSTITSTGALGGIVWSPNYWPNTLNFAVNTVSSGANAIEVWECDFDYAFGVTTATHVSGEGSSGCAGWGVTVASSPTYPSQLALIQ